MQQLGMERSDKEPRQGDPRAPQELSISSPKAKPVAPPPPPKPPKKPGGKRVPIDVALQQVARDGSLATDAGTSSRTHLSVAPNDAAQAREDTNLAQIEQHEVYNKLSPRHSNGAEEPTSPAIHPKSSHSNGYSNPFDEDVEEGQANKKLPPTKPLVKQEESAVVRMRKANLHFTNSTVAPRVTGGEPNNMIYHKSRLSEGWVIGAVFLLILQMSFLLGIGYDALPVGTLVVLLFLIVVIVGLFIRTRLWVRKSRMSNMRNIKLRGGICTPDDEADVVPDKAVYCLVWASLLLGIVYSVFTAVAAGNGSQLQQDGFQSQETVLQVTIYFLLE